MLIRLPRPTGKQRPVAALLVLAVLSLIAISSFSSPVQAKRPARLTIVYLEGRGVVGPTKTGGSSKQCPNAAPHAISGYFGSDSTSAQGQITISRSTPVGKGDRRWSVGVRDLGNQPQPYFIGVICASAVRPFVRVRATGTVAPGKTNGSNELCPTTAPKPISGFFHPKGTDNGQLRLAQSAATNKGWSTVVENPTGKPQAYVVGAVCAPRSQKTAFLSSGQLTVGPGAVAGSSGHCPKTARYAIGGAFAASNRASLGLITFAGSSPIGTGVSDWSAGVVNLTSQPQPFFVGTVCLG